MIVDALATYRLTRLVVKDGITKPPRDAVLAWALRPYLGSARHPKVAELLGCSWCVSVWAALAVLALRRVPGGRLLIRALALSAVAGLIAENA